MKTIGRIALGIVVLAVALAGYILQGRGLFTNVENQFAGTCTAVDGVIGAEDLTIHPDTGIVYLSAYDRRAWAAGNPFQAGIYAYDLETEGAIPVNLTVGFSDNFRPHGISLWRNPGIGEDAGPDRLFVINHPGGDHSVEIFEITGIGLRHVETIQGDALISPNDLVAVGKRAFIATNDLTSQGTMRMLESYLRLPLSSVVSYDGNSFSTLIDNVAFPNGINTNADGTMLYVASAAWGHVTIYDRDPASGAISNPVEVEVEGLADNIEIAPNGDLLLGIHPKHLALLASINDPESVAPSRVVRISPTDTGGYEVTTIYDNIGEALSGGSTGAIYHDRLVIGTIFDDHFLDCVME